MITRRSLLLGAVAAPAIIRPSVAQILQFSGAPLSGLSDSDWPDVGNRPTISGQVLTWVGPLGGGPNNGAPVQQTRTLTNQSGITSTANGQVFQGLKISGDILITHNNCVIKQCYQIATGGGFFNCNVQGTGILIEDFGSDGTGGSLFDCVTNSTGNGLSTATIRRCNFFNYENHITGSPINCTITDNWFHVAQGTDADMIECYGGSTGSLLQHNTLDGRDTASGKTLNSGINLTNFSGSVTSMQLVNNRFLAMPNHAINNDSSQSTGALTWSATNNGFWTSPTPNRSNTSLETLSPNSGNFVMAVVGAQSGTPINGTGQLVVV